MFHTRVPTVTNKLIINNEIIGFLIRGSKRIIYYNKYVKSYVLQKMNIFLICNMQYFNIKLLVILNTQMVNININIIYYIF